MELAVTLCVSGAKSIICHITLQITKLNLYMPESLSMVRAIILKIISLKGLVGSNPISGAIWVDSLMVK